MGVKEAERIPGKLQGKCLWCDAPLKVSFAIGFCSEECHSRHNEHMRDLYDEGKGGRNDSGDSDE